MVEKMFPAVAFAPVIHQTHHPASVRSPRLQSISWVVQLPSVILKWSAGNAASKTNEGNDVIVGRDKEGFWASLNGNEVDPVNLAKDLEFMCDDDGCSPLCASEMALYRMSFPFKLADYGVKPLNAGTAVLNGEKVNLLDVTFDPKVGHDRWIFFVDPSTKYIRKIEHYSSLKDNVQPEEIYLSDFKKAGNIMLSHSNKYYRSNGKILEEYLVSDVKFNTALTTDFFNRPQQLSMFNK